MNSEPVIVIKPSPRISFPDLRELWDYRELMLTFVIRDLKIRYRQTVIGGLWAILQPFTTMIIFSFFFGRIAKIPSEGVPYPIFSYAGLVLWTYFANALSSASGSILGSSALFTKVYFPRIIAPVAATVTGLVDYGVALIIVIGLMIFYHVAPTPALLLLPLAILPAWMFALGLGFWIGSVNVKYRDIGYIMPFFLSLLLYMTPVIYPISIAPNFRNFLQLNPMAGVIEAHRAMILGHTAINFYSLGISYLISSIILVGGAIFFRSVERKFADIV